MDVSTADVIAANIDALLSLVSPSGDGEIRVILNDIWPKIRSARRRRRRSSACSRWWIWSGGWGRWGVDPVLTGDEKSINSELWHACAGPLVSLSPVGSLVVYFPRGHSEQVAASMQKETDSIPIYPSLPSKLICMLDSMSMHGDPKTDEVYAKMTHQPVNKYDKDAFLASDMWLKQSKQPVEFFCKTLTASDTSMHGGFFVPRRAAQKSFPPLVFSFSLSLLFNLYCD